MAISQALVDSVVRKSFSLLPALRQWTGLGGKNLAWKNLADFVAYLAHGVDRQGLEDRIQRHLINPLLVSKRVRRAWRAKGIGGLSSIILTPTVSCNLDCTLCYNKHHQDPQTTLPLATMDRVVGEGKALGAYRVSIIGGEPLLVWQDIYALAARHTDVVFTVMTNGTLCTAEIASQLASLGNIELSFSIDGLQKTNDTWRAAGTFAKVLQAMALYRRQGGLVAYSPTVTTANYQELLSDEFVELMIRQGAYLGYYHHYYLVGGQQRKELLLETSQLDWIQNRCQELMRTKPILIFDNVLSSLFTTGCQATKEYVHINHRGDVEPCCMVQFAVDNVNRKPLAEILAAPFFARLRDIPAGSRQVKKCLVGANAHHFQECVTKERAAASVVPAATVFGFINADFAHKLPTCFAGTRSGGG